MLVSLRPWDRTSRLPRSETARDATSAPAGSLSGAAREPAVRRHAEAGPSRQEANKTSLESGIQAVLEKLVRSEVSRSGSPRGA